LYQSISVDDRPVMYDGCYLFIDADYYLPVNSDYIPAGKPEKLTGTPFDFYNLKRSIGQGYTDFQHIRSITDKTRKASKTY
jgi:hypothetical protein